MMLEPAADTRPLLTRHQVAQQLGIQLRTLHRMLAEGELPFVKLGYAVRIEAGDVERLIRTHKNEARADNADLVKIGDGTADDADSR